MLVGSPLHGYRKRPSPTPARLVRRRDCIRARRRHNVSRIRSDSQSSARTVMDFQGDCRERLLSIRPAAADALAVIARGAQALNENIFAVARWPGDDVVLAFVNLRDQAVGPDLFAVPGGVPLDCSAGVRHQAFKLVADNPDAPLWPQPRTAADLRANGALLRSFFPTRRSICGCARCPELSFTHSGSPILGKAQKACAAARCRYSPAPGARNRAGRAASTARFSSAEKSRHPAISSSER